VRLLRNAQNVGFGRGINQAIAACTAGRVLVMNPDCQLRPGSLALLQAGPGCRFPLCDRGAADPNPDGTPQGNARGDPNMLTGLFGRTGVLRRTLPELDVARRNVIGGNAGDRFHDRRLGVGACLLARREALAEVGGFDERYFMYWEDADLCRRLRQRGYTIRYVPAASAVHRVGQSSRSAPAASIRAFHDSAYLYYSSHVAPGASVPGAGSRAGCWRPVAGGSCDRASDVDTDQGRIQTSPDRD
jgi:GT2 family glycosyltransferase